MVIQPLYNHKVPQPKNRKPGYFATIVVNAIMVVVANKVLDWNIEQITSTWQDLLPLLNILFVATMFAYFCLLIYDPPRLYFLARTLLDGFGIYVFYRVFATFPFNFSTLNLSWFDTFIRYAILVGIGITIVAVVVRAVRLVIGKNVYY